MRIVHVKSSSNLILVLTGSQRSLRISTFEPIDHTGKDEEPVRYLSVIEKIERSGWINIDQRQVYDQFGLSPVKALLRGSANIELSPKDFGYLEWTDHALFTFGIQFGSVAWRNHFVETGPGRVQTGKRQRELFGGQVLASLAVPFVNHPETSRLELYSKEKPIVNVPGQTIAQVMNEEDIPRGDWITHFWRVVASDQKIRPNETVEVPLQLRWNATKKNCNYATTVNARTDAGYLPRQKVTFDKNGQGKVKITAMGLVPGEKIKISFGVGAYTDVGEVNLTVQA